MSLLVVGAYAGMAVAFYGGYLVDQDQTIAGHQRGARWILGGIVVSVALSLLQITVWMTTGGR